MTAANITRSGRRRRALAGVAFLLLAAGAGAGMFVLRLHPAWRLLLIVPVWIGVVDLWQAKARC